MPRSFSRPISQRCRPMSEAEPVAADDGSAFTVESLTRYFIHDPVHHLWDVHG